MTPGVPFEELAVKLAGDAWTVAMLGLWDAGLWMLRLVLSIIDALVVPDLSADGPGRQVYGVAFWLAGALVTVLLLVQLGVAVLRRDGAALAVALTGTGKFLVVWAGWLAYGAAVVAACGADPGTAVRAVAGPDVGDVGPVRGVGRRGRHRRHRGHGAGVDGAAAVAGRDRPFGGDDHPGGGRCWCWRR